MIRKKNNLPFSLRRMLLSLVFLTTCISFQTIAAAQKISISFPIGSTVYKGSEIPLTILVEGVSCNNTVIKCHQGLVSMIGQCKYIYRCKRVGLDTIEVFTRKGQKLQRVGEQVFAVKESPCHVHTSQVYKEGELGKVH
jgi:hypothetical protein